MTLAQQIEAELDAIVRDSMSAIWIARTDRKIISKRLADALGRSLDVAQASTDQIEIKRLNGLLADAQIIIDDYNAAEIVRVRADVAAYGEPGGARAQAAADPVIECWSIVEQLRAPEGAEVILLCDNPDFNGRPNNAIAIVDDWTMWSELRFTGDTVLDCLRAALAARNGHISTKA